MCQLQAIKFYCEQSSYSHSIGSMRKILGIYPFDIDGFHITKIKIKKKQQKKQNTKSANLLEFRIH